MDLTPKLEGPILEKSDFMALVFLKILPRAQIIKGAMGPPLAIVSLPCLDLLLGVFQRQKPVRIQTFVSEAAIK